MLVFHHTTQGGSVTEYQVRHLFNRTRDYDNYTVFVASKNGDGAVGPENSATFIYGQ